MSIALETTDRLTPFMLEGGAVRGRVVALSAVADTVLGRYDYPAHVAQLLGELLAAAAMLSANLKQEGVFTLQIRGRGAVPLVVVDAVYGGALRGFAEVPESSVETINALTDYSPQALVGVEGYLAITLDPGVGMQRYQGVVALDGDSVAHALTSYFTHSEQIEAQVMLSVARASHGWRVGGMMLERMPEVAAAQADAWPYARAIAATVKPAELLDPLLDAPTLLYRLFHEQGVWVYPSHMLSVGCRCSRQRMLDLLGSMPLTDRAEMVVDGAVRVHCQFCNKTERFTPAELGLSVN